MNGTIKKFWCFNLSCENTWDIDIHSRIESDHLPITFSFISGHNTNDDNNTPNDPFGSSDLRTSSCSPRYKWKSGLLNPFLNRWKHPRVTELLQSFHNALDLVQIDRALSVVTDILNYVGKCMQCPHGKYGNKLPCNKSSNSTWFDDECIDFKNRVQNKLRFFRRSKSDDALACYKNTKAAYKQFLENKKMIFKNQQRDQILECLKHHDSKGFWSKLKGSQNTITSEITPDSWFNYFENLFQMETFVEDALISDPVGHDEIEGNWTDFLNSQITSDEIKSSINALKVGKAPGIDGFPPEFFKYSPTNELTSILMKLFNLILTSGSFPLQWASSLIVPIFKKGSKTDPANYRGISLIPILSKVFSKILLDRLQFWSDANNVIHQEQAGFRKGFRTTDNVFILDTIINKYLSQKRGRIYIGFVDFRKAFDLVNHDALLYKLKCHGIVGNILTILSSMYMQLNACVRTPMGVTNVFQCKAGVQQGSVLSPFLFKLFINDLSTRLNSLDIPKIQINNCFINHLLFADDLALISSSVFGLQKQFNVLAEYCKSWGLSVNIDKTKIMVFKNGGKLKRIEKWSYDGNQIEVVNSFKYLGNVFSSNGHWSKAHDFNATQANKAYFGLLQILKNVGTLPVNVLFKIFDSKLKPILLFGNELWGTSSCKVIEQFHIKFCRYVLGVSVSSKSIPHCAIRGELGRYSLLVNSLVNCVKYWLYILSLDENRFLRQSYEFQFKKAERGKDCWALRIKNILFTYGFGEIWIAQGVVNANIFIDIFKQRCKDIDVQNWRAALRKYSSLTFYNLIKRNFETENYLLLLDKPIQKILLTKARLGFLKLEYVRGIWFKIPHNERVCKICDSGEIEDIYHFIVKCSAYENERRRFLTDYIPNYNYLITIFQSCDKNTIISLSRFIYHAYNIRQTMLPPGDV